MTEKFNFKAICDLATRVMNLPKDSLAYKSRTRKLQSARSIAAFIALTEEGISRKVIADILKKDRTVTYHYVKFHNKNLDNCDIYRDCFTKIYKEYKNIDGEKDIFVNKRQMRNHLLQSGVTEKENSDIKLMVQSGEIIVEIRTDYFDFSTQIVNIEKAMENYHYSIKII